jgi:hypothetical protein
MKKEGTCGKQSQHFWYAASENKPAIPKGLNCIAAVVVGHFSSIDSGGRK